MRIAVAYADGEVFQHFGKTTEFKIYEIDNDEIVDSKVFGTNGVGHGALALVLNQLKVEALICGGIGRGAKSALSAVEITILPGVTGNADDAVKAYIAGTLEYDPDVKCTEEEDEHECSPSMCGSCMSTSCGH